MKIIVSGFTILRSTFLITSSKIIYYHKSLQWTWHGWSRDHILFLGFFAKADFENSGQNLKSSFEFICQFKSLVIDYSPVE